MHGYDIAHVEGGRKAELNGQWSWGLAALMDRRGDANRWQSHWYSQ